MADGDAIGREFGARHHLEALQPSVALMVATPDHALQAASDHLRISRHHSSVRPCSAGRAALFSTARSPARRYRCCGAHIRGKLRQAPLRSRASTTPHFAHRRSKLADRHIDFARRRGIRADIGSAPRRLPVRITGERGDFSSWLGAAVEAGPAHGAPGRRAAIARHSAGRRPPLTKTSRIDRILVWLLEGRAGRRSSPGSKAPDIGIRAGFKRAAILDPQIGRGRVTRPVHRLLKRDQLFVTHVATEQARKIAIGARMRYPIQEDAPSVACRRGIEQSSSRQLDLFADSVLRRQEIDGADARDPSSTTRSSATSSGGLPRIAATSASVLPVSGFSASFLKPDRIILSAGAEIEIFPIAAGLLHLALDAAGSPGLSAS